MKPFSTQFSAPVCPSAQLNSGTCSGSPCSRSSRGISAGHPVRMRAPVLPARRCSVSTWNGSSGRVLGRKSSKRVQCGEPVRHLSNSRYLIDFITGLSDVSSGFARLDSDPSMDSSSLSDQHPPNESAPAHRACQRPDGRPVPIRSTHLKRGCQRGFMPLTASDATVAEFTASE